MTSNSSMPIFLIDSNIILDILLDKNDEHANWSINTVIKYANQGHFAINQIIYAEVAYAFSDLQELEIAMRDYQKLSLPWEAAFIASKAFAAYRRNGGARHTLMPDFYIGAHALFSKLILITRDQGYNKYFPKLEIISP